MSRVVKSVYWLVGCSAIGYGLLLAITPDGRLIKEKHPEVVHSDTRKRTQDILEHLKLAANTQKPLYRESKEEVYKELKK